MTETLTISPIGGSEAAASVGLNPYVSQVELYLRKRGELPEREPNEAMAWGTALQPVIAAEVERRGYVVLPAPTDAVLDSERPWMSGHPDGYIGRAPALRDEENPGSFGKPSSFSRGILELKTASPFVHGWDRPEGPMHYEIQVRHYLALTDLDWGLLACLVGGQRLELKRIEREAKLEANLVELEREFYERCVSGDPPPPDGSDSSADVLRQLYPKATPEKVVTLTIETLRARDKYRQAREMVKQWQKAKDTAAQTIQAALGDAEVGVYEGEMVATWKHVSVKESVRPARVDRRLHVP